MTLIPRKLKGAVLNAVDLSLVAAIEHYDLGEWIWAADIEAVEGPHQSLTRDALYKALERLKVKLDRVSHKYELHSRQGMGFRLWLRGVGG